MSLLCQSLWHPYTYIFTCIGNWFRFDSEAKSGVYKIEAETKTNYTKVYCEMTSLGECASGGWTMMMKINGSQVNHLVIYLPIQIYSGLGSKLYSIDRLILTILTNDQFIEYFQLFIQILDQQGELQPRRRAHIVWPKRN